MLETVREVEPRCPICARSSAREWDAFIAAGDRRVALPDVEPGDPVMIQYTSGTTGFPKGALLHHRGLVNNGADTAERMGIDEGDVYITAMPLFHTGGCVCSVLGAVSNAATQVMVEAFEPGLMLELIERTAPTRCSGCRQCWSAMLEQPELRSTDLSSVKAICSGGSIVPAAMVPLLKQKLGAPFTIVFGQTECSPVAAHTRTTDTIEDKADTIGLPCRAWKSRSSIPIPARLPIGGIGEICTRGYHMMLGYFEMPEATATAIEADGWLQTGDLCAMDTRGYCRSRAA